MAFCKEHPGRPAVFLYNGNQYCQRCKDGYKAAVASVDVHVEPKDCFVTYDGNDHWHSFSRDGWTGCAHWVAHQKNIQTGFRCLKGFTVRVTELAAYLRSRGKEILKLEEVREQDVWVAPDERHTGIVWSIQPDVDPTHPKDLKKRIIVRHDSSGQHRVAENELQWLMHHGHGPGPGRFYRVL